MGQQQLILLVVAVVIVGLATVVGIQAFQDNKVKANVDALTQDVVRMASDAQAWKQKPSPFGGQGLNEAADPDAPYPAINYTGLDDLGQLGYKIDTGTAIYSNLNGQYRITTVGGANGVIITGANCEMGNTVSIVVDGINDVDLTSHVEAQGATNAAVTAGVCAAVVEHPDASFGG